MRTKACLGLQCGVGAVGETSLKDMKVLIGQRGNQEVYAEGERLWNGQAFLHFDCLCGSANQKTGKECEKGPNAELLSSFTNVLLKTFCPC